jgi:hypothetical protein
MLERGKKFAAKTKAKMKKVLLILFLAGSTVSVAQVKGFGFGPYVEAAWPSGDFKESNKDGFGAGFGADIRLGKAGLTGSVGYMYFGGQTVHTGNETADMPSVNVVPVRAGIKYRLAPAIYAKLESGVAKFTGENKSAIIFSPGLGIRVLGLDVQAKYEVWKNDQTFSFLGLKAGFNF